MGNLVNWSSLNWNHIGFPLACYRVTMGWRILFALVSLFQTLALGGAARLYVICQQLGNRIDILQRAYLFIFDHFPHAHHFIAQPRHIAIHFGYFLVQLPHCCIWPRGIQLSCLR